MFESKTELFEPNKKYVIVTQNKTEFLSSKTSIRNFRGIKSNTNYLWEIDM